MMFSNYFKIAIRNIHKHKTCSFIHICGLSIGISVCLLLALYVTDELNFDRYHLDYNRIFRINREIQNELGKHVNAQSPGPLMAALKNDYPQVENACRLWQNMNLVIHTSGQTQFYDASNHVFADPEFFDMFDFHFVQGSAFLYKNTPNALIVTTEIANRLFQTTEIIGQSLNMNDVNYTITGVIRSIPHNTHLPKFNFATSFQSIEQQVHLESWIHGVGVKTYVKLKNKVDPEDFTNQIAKIADLYASDQLKITGQAHTFSLQPIHRIHLYDDLNNPSKNTKAAGLILFSAIALLILLIACFNFMNLSTARSTVRTKEIGIRKTLGAQKKQLMTQFLGESLLISLISVGVSFLLISFILPWFNQLTSKQIDFSTIPLLQMTGILLMIMMITGFASGLYPAFILASLKPTTLFMNFITKSKRNASRSQFSLRKILVIAQFAIGSIFIIAILVVSNQIRFMKMQDLGFDRDSIMVLPIHTVKMSRYLKENESLVKNELTRHHAIESTTFHLKAPGRMSNQDEISLLTPGEPIKKWVNMQFSDDAFLKTYDIPLLSGKNFTTQNPDNQTTQFLLNRSALKTYGFQSPEQAPGWMMSLYNLEGNIVGVFEDFHFWSLKYQIEPLVLIQAPDFFPEAISLKFNTNQTSEVIAYLTDTFYRLFPDQPFQYYFLDSDFNQVYRADEQYRSIILISAGLAVVIASLGLFGLVLFTTERRTKEIGIRKVMGVTVPGIWLLLVKDFMKWIALAAFIAWPIGWILMNQWLQNYAYRIHLGWWMMIQSSAIVLTIALLTVSWQAVRAATANPVKSLRYE